jgi:hypothetical protein
MGQLEKTLKETPLKISEPKREESYEGLRLIEDNAYKSGTSIKYWM